MTTLTIHGKTATVGEVWRVRGFDEDREIKGFDLHHDKVSDILSDLVYQGKAVTKAGRDEIERDYVICDLDNDEWCYFRDLYRRTRR